MIQNQQALSRADPLDFDATNARKPWLMDPSVSQPSQCPREHLMLGLKDSGRQGFGRIACADQNH